MTRRFRGGCVIAAAGALTVALAGPGVPAAAAAAAPTPLSVLLAAFHPTTDVDLTALHNESLAVLTRNYQAGVDAANQAVSTAIGNAEQARATLTSDQATSQSAVAHAANATETLAATTTAHAAAVTAHQAAVTSLSTDQDRLAQVGVSLYMGPPPAVADVNQDLSGTQTSYDGIVYLDTGGTELSQDITTDKRAVKTTTATEERLAQQQTGDQVALDQANAAEQAASTAVTTASTALTTAQKAQTAAQTALTNAQTAMTAAVTGFGAASGDGSPTIMGSSAMVPAQLAGFFTSSAYDDLTTATPAQLAAFYISEGDAEGVRGDVAFAQALVETGGFSSPDAINLNNYAGVGHCDSCAQGLAFPSPQGGVRGQVQLLRIFASPAGTQLTQPAIIPQVAPSGQFRGACCPSWQSLTGTWATATDYGQVVLGVYQRMLDYAMSQPPIIPGSPAAGDNPPSTPQPAGTSPETGSSGTGSSGSEGDGPTTSSTTTAPSSTT